MSPCVVGYCWGCSSPSVSGLHTSRSISLNFLCVALEDMSVLGYFFYTLLLTKQHTVYFCLYGPFNRISFHKFSRQLSAFSLCSSRFISASLVLSTVCLFIKVSFGPDVIPSDWLGLEHQLTNFFRHRLLLSFVSCWGYILPFSQDMFEV